MGAISPDPAALAQKEEEVAKPSWAASPYVSEIGEDGSRCSRRSCTCRPRLRSSARGPVTSHHPSAERRLIRLGRSRGWAPKAIPGPSAPARAGGDRDRHGPPGSHPSQLPHTGADDRTVTASAGHSFASGRGELVAPVSHRLTVPTQPWGTTACEFLFHLLDFSPSQSSHPSSTEGDLYAVSFCSP